MEKFTQKTLTCNKNRHVFDAKLKNQPQDNNDNEEEMAEAHLPITSAAGWNDSIEDAHARRRERDRNVHWHVKYTNALEMYKLDAQSQHPESWEAGIHYLRQKAVMFPTTDKHSLREKEIIYKACHQLCLQRIKELTKAKYYARMTDVLPVIVIVLLCFYIYQQYMRIL